MPAGKRSEIQLFSRVQLADNFGELCGTRPSRELPKQQQQGRHTQPVGAPSFTISGPILWGNLFLSSVNRPADSAVVPALGFWGFTLPWV